MMYSLQKTLFYLMPLFIVAFSFISLSKTIFIGLLLALLLLWLISFRQVYGGPQQRLNGQHGHQADLPLLFLVTGTFMYGKAFSIIGFESLGLPLYITEILLAFCLVALLLKEKSPKALWDTWAETFPKGLLPVIGVYFLMGTIYIISGFFANGALALRDIVICHYIVILFFTLSLISRLPKPRELFRLFVPLMIILFIFGFIAYFIRVPSSAAFKSFIRITKMTSLALSTGLVVIFGLSLYGTLKKKGKIIAFVLIYIAFLLVIMSEVRAGWVGLVVALILMAILLKKEIKVILLVLLLLAASLWAIDHFGLTIKKNKIAGLKTQVTAMTKPREFNLPGANIKWRLGIWKETIDAFAQKPILGWGFGVQIDYLIWGDRLSVIKAAGSSTGIVPAHNHVLALAHKLGLVGLLLFLFINARIFFYGLGYLKKCNSEFNRRLIIASLAGLLYWHGMAFFFDVLESPPTGIFLWMLLGIILAVIHKDKKTIA